jgi:hypothetical protein
MMRAKQLPLLLVALALMTLVTVPAFADPIIAGGVAVGDRYAVTTISGEARAWFSGSWVASSADLQLMVQVTYVGPTNIIFRVLSGTIQFNGRVYRIIADGWRGDHNRVSKTCVYQGPAIAPNGARTLFIIYGHDTRDTQQGTYMRMWSAFRDENTVLWRIDLQTYRFKLN